MEGKTMQRLSHPGIHTIINHQRQTQLHMPARFCWKNLDIAVSCEGMPVPGKYRSECSLSSIGWNTGSPMEEQENVPKESTRVGVCKPIGWTTKSNWAKDLNIKLDTLDLIEEKTGNSLELIGTRSNFLNRTPTAQALRSAVDKWDWKAHETEKLL